MENDLKQLVNENEKILYEGKPNKKCFIFESIFNPLMPFALVWLLFDLFISGGIFFSGATSNVGFFIIPFMLLHLMPVWIYLGGVLFTSRKYKNTYYIVTDSGIYVSGGIFSKTYNHKPFAELSHVNLHRGIFDQMFNVGDIVMTSNQFMNGNMGNNFPGYYRNNSLNAAIAIRSVSNYVEVYNLVNKLQKDIYTDVMYPNDMRPPENNGYNTKYKG